MKWRLFCCLSVLFLMLLLFLLPHGGFQADLDCWWIWATWIDDMGLARIYETPVNYHPVWLYCLQGYAKICESREAIMHNVHLLKIVPLCFDFLSALLAFSWLRQGRQHHLLPFLLLFNIAFLYNSLIWGQVDSIPTFWIALAITSALSQRLVWSIFFFVIAINTKLQAIIFLPLLGLLCLPQVWRRPRLLAKGLLVLIGTQILLMLPFLWQGTAQGYWQVIVGAVDKYPVASLNAFNLWYFFFPQPAQLSDSSVFFQFSLKSWGQLMFFGLSALVLFPLAEQTWQSIRWQKQIEGLAPQAFLTGALICIVFFFFNTQMHERYSHSALLLFFLYGLLQKKYALYWLCTLAYFLNLEKVL